MEVRVEQLHDDVQLVVVLADEEVFQRHDIGVRPEVPVRTARIKKTKEREAKLRERENRACYY